MNELPPLAVMRRTFARKDATFEGTFFVGVKTTGVFCRPTCRAKPAREHNLEFFCTAKQAMRQGYRPCKLCRPMQTTAPVPMAVNRLMELVEQRAGERITERELRAIGIHPSTARRQFRAYGKMSFAAWQRCRRLAAAVQRVKRGGSVMQAQIEAGFESSGAFRAALKREFKTTGSAVNAVSLLWSRRIDTPLGTMLAVASDDGLVMLEFGDQNELDQRVERMCQKLGAGPRNAVVTPGDHPHLARVASELSEYFAGPRRSFSVPLAPCGTEFEERAWNYLRSIPYGQTRSYGQQAQAIGSPRAVRAVGRANSRNPIAIVVPCHRVIGADGTLTGYAGGMARKRWLLAHEQRSLAS